MALWTLFGLTSGKATTSWPAGNGADGQDEVLGMPRYNAPACQEGCRDCAEVRPTHAIEASNGERSVDYGRCVVCQLCTEACPIGAIQELQEPLLGLGQRAATRQMCYDPIGLVAADVRGVGEPPLGLEISGGNKRPLPPPRSIRAHRRSPRARVHGPSRRKTRRIRSAFRVRLRVAAPRPDRACPKTRRRSDNCRPRGRRSRRIQGRWRRSQSRGRCRTELRPCPCPRAGKSLVSGRKPSRAGPRRPRG